MDNFNCVFCGKDVRFGGNFSEVIIDTNRGLLIIASYRILHEYWVRLVSPYSFFELALGGKNYANKS
jgi:hypothetical protein